jgi:hypothetical protein
MQTDTQKHNETTTEKAFNTMNNDKSSSGQLDPLVSPRELIRQKAQYLEAIAPLIKIKVDMMTKSSSCLMKNVDGFWIIQYPAELQKTLDLIDERIEQIKRAIFSTP